MQKVIIYTDGGARGNPGPAGAGAVMLDENGKVLKEISDYLGETTNNVAEYQALIRILAAAGDMFGDALTQYSFDVRMDSELIVRQLQGAYKVKAPGLKPLFLQVKQLLSSMSHVTFKHIPREENKEADRLVNEAIDQGV